MAIPNYFTAPEAWHKVTLGTYKVPALLVAINGVKVEDEWAVQRQIGTSGSVTIWRGTLPTTDLKLSFEAADAAMFDGLAKLYDSLKPISGRKPPTVKIEHPAPNFVGITRVSRKLWEGPMVGSKLSVRVDLTLIQYFPQKFVPVGPAEPAKLPGEPTPTDKAEVMIQQLSAKIDSLL